MTKANFFNAKFNLTSAGLACASFCAILSSCPTYAATSAIDSLKDSNFKNCVLQTYNRDNHTSLTKLTAKQLSSITSLACNNSNIKRTTGIERLTKLQSLSLAGNQLSTIDLAKNTKLTYLDLSSNRLKALNLTKQTKLTTLRINGNQLTTLNLKKNKQLSSLYADNILLETNATASQAGSIYVLDLSKVPFFHASSTLYAGGLYDYMDNYRLLATKSRKALNSAMTTGTGFNYVYGSTYRLKLPAASNVSMNTVVKQLVKMYKDHATSYAQLVAYLDPYDITEAQVRSATKSLKVNYGDSAIKSDLAKLLGYFAGKNSR